MDEPGKRRVKAIKLPAGNGGGQLLGRGRRGGRAAVAHAHRRH
jgi:hypothetical protein